MKPISNFEAKPMTSSSKLPAGAYVARILTAEVVSYPPYGDKLNITFDIVEGEYAGFFRQDYDSSTYTNKKWKGRFAVNIPDESDAEHIEMQKRIFGNLVWAVEQSNKGYHWDWVEHSLVGKFVGVVFRNKEWEWDGKTGWTTECGTVVDIEAVRGGNVKPMKDVPLKHKEAVETASAEAFELSENDAGLPF